MCGTTRREDALEAVRLGVDALGFIFYRRSPRCIELAAAGDIIALLPPLVDRVGVFVNAPLEEIEDCAVCGLSMVQLHGGESPQFCREVRAALPHCRVIKAFRVGEGSTPEEFAAYDESVDAFLLDTYVKGAPGGTGQIFDWSRVRELRLARPVFLAGGLTPENVVRAIDEVAPFAIDINSGVEVQPGVKDPLRLAQLLGEVARLSGR